MIGQLALSPVVSNANYDKGSSGAAQAAVLIRPLLHTAGLIAITASILNARASGRQAPAAGKLRYFLPGPQSPVLAGLATNIGATFRPGLELQEFLAEVALASRYTESEIGEIESSHAAAASVAGGLAGIWRGLAASAQLHLLQLSAMLERGDRQAVDFALAQSMRLLTDARSGNSPCLDDSGAIVFGDIIGRWKSPRLTVDMQVEIRNGRILSQARVCDVSAGGVGLNEVQGLEPHEAVTIEFGGGRVMRGTVAWTRNGQAGIAFEKELEAANPLLDWAAAWPCPA